MYVCVAAILCIYVVTVQGIIRIRDLLHEQAYKTLKSGFTPEPPTIIVTGFIKTNQIVTTIDLLLKFVATLNHYPGTLTIRLYM